METDSGYLSQREKIKLQLLNKFLNKYPSNEIKPYLSTVINKFVENDEITIPNLKLLDSHIKEEAIKFPENNRRTRSLQIFNSENLLPNINDRNWDAGSVTSKASRMSGVSQLSKFSDHKKPKFNIKPIEDMYKNEIKSITPSYKPLLSKFSYDSEDEWGSILKYNNLMHKEEQKKSLEREKNIKDRFKTDLNEQIKIKQEKKQEEKINNLHYDIITNKHAEYLKELDQKQRDNHKLKCLEDKEKLDYQVKCNKNYRKKIKRVEDLNGKLFLKSIIEENIRAKSLEMEKKKSLKDNFKGFYEEEENLLKRMKKKDKIKQEDKKFSDDYDKVLEQRDNERDNYRKMVKAKGNFSDNIQGLKTKLEMDNKLQEEANLTNKLIEEAKMRYQKEEEIKRKNIIENKADIRSFLNIQMDEKKRKDEYEKYRNIEQAKLWRKDDEYFRDYVQQNRVKVIII